MRLRTLLLLGYAAVIAILLISGTVVVMSARDGMKETIAHDAEALAAAMMDEIDLAMRSRVETLTTTVGLSPELHRMIQESNADFAALGSPAEIAREIAARDVAWTDAATGPATPDMQAILDGEASVILRSVMSFHERMHGHPVFGEIFVTNCYGANVGQTGRTEDYMQEGEPWWDEAMADGAWISDEVAMDESANVVSVDIGVRVDDVDGEPIGVLKAVMTVGVVRDIIDGFGERSLLDGAVVELLDADGRLIHRMGCSDDVFREDLSGQDAVQGLLDGRTDAVVERVDGVENLRAYVGSRARSNGVSPGWSLIFNQPTAVAYEPLNKMTGRMLIAGVFGAVLAVLVGWLISSVFGRITQRLEDTSDALRDSEAQVRSIVTNAVDGIVTADTMGLIETFNPAAEQIFGRSAAEVVGRNLRMLMPESIASDHDSYLRRYRETGEARVMGTPLEVRGLRADGTEFSLDLALGEIKEGGKHRYVGVLRDATERREAKRALEEAKDVAEGASRSKSQFLANMSHELRTPLNAIIGYSEMIAEELDEGADSETASDLGKIRTAGLSLLGLIDQILDLSKVEAGRLEAFSEPFDLNVAMKDIEATILPLMRKSENELHVDAPDDLGMVMSDVTKLRQILLNLLSNAAKFTKCGSVELRARRESAEPHDWMVFRVRDDGIGMTPDQLERVWDAFAQADASTTRRYGGTGLGLTISRKFAELLGGTVDAASRPGAGTTFTVRLPAPRPPSGDPVPDTLTPIETKSETITAELTSRTILVIDDDAATRDLVRRFLSSEGFTVVEAATGDEGLRLVHELRPAAVVLDVLMPGMDGWSVLAALREDPVVGATPVVMLTISEQRDLGFALGVDAYLSKPVHREALALALAPYHSGRGPQRILVVEDDEATRQLIARVVRRGGFDVAEAANGSEALQCLEERGADLAIVDLMMPVMDGFELVHAMRADERWRNLPVIVVTARDVAGDDARRLDGVVQEIVRKGHYTTEELLDEVGRLVHRATRRQG